MIACAILWFKVVQGHRLLHKSKANMTSSKLSQSSTLGQYGPWGRHQSGHTGYHSDGTQEVMRLAPRPATFNSLLFRYPSQLSGLRAHQKSQAQTWIWTGDPEHGSLMPWVLDHCALFCFISISPQKSGIPPHPNMSSQHWIPLEFRRQTFHAKRWDI